MEQYNEQQIKELKIKMYECAAKKECHKRASIAYDKYDKITGIPQVVLSAVLSSLSVTNLQTENCQDNSSIALVICSGTLAALSSLSRYFEFGKMKESHKKTSFAYGKLERVIQLEINKVHKKKFDELFENIINEYNNVRENSHIIPQFIGKQYSYTECLKNELDKDSTILNIG